MSLPRPLTLTWSKVAPMIRQELEQLLKSLSRAPEGYVNGAVQGFTLSIETRRYGFCALIDRIGSFAAHSEEEIINEMAEAIETKLEQQND